MKLLAFFYRTNQRLTLLCSILLFLVVLLVQRSRTYNRNPPDPITDQVSFAGEDFEIETICPACTRHWILHYSQPPKFLIKIKNTSGESDHRRKATLSLTAEDRAENLGHSPSERTRELKEITLPSGGESGHIPVDVPPHFLSANTESLVFTLAQGSERYKGYDLSVDWRIPFDAEYPFWLQALVETFIFAFVAFMVSLFWSESNALATVNAKSEAAVSAAVDAAKADRNDTKLSWEIARIKLEAYFDRNLLQVRQVFLLACAVMMVGFVFVLIGIALAVSRVDSGKTYPSLIAACSGIITQFIGATFMVIYRSTMAQANEFMGVLERINTVGMAVQVVNVISDASDLKDDARAEIATLLLGGTQRPRSRSSQKTGTSSKRRTRAGDPPTA